MVADAEMSLQKSYIIKPYQKIKQQNFAVENIVKECSDNEVPKQVMLTVTNSRQHKKKKGAWQQKFFFTFMNLIKNEVSIFFTWPSSNTRLISVESFKEYICGEMSLAKP